MVWPEGSDLTPFAALSASQRLECLLTASQDTQVSGWAIGSQTGRGSVFITSLTRKFIIVNLISTVWLLHDFSTPSCRPTDATWSWWLSRPPPPTPAWTSRP